MKNKKILYLGDTTLDQAASYLAGIMDHASIAFDYRASDWAFVDEGNYAAVILSDYPASNFTAAQLDDLAAKVNNGMGLLMIGGWESFVGQGGNYHQTPLADVLPVVMGDADDRMNHYGPCAIGKCADHAIIDGLPFVEHPASFNGFNRVKAKNDAKEILSVRPYRIAAAGDAFEFIGEQSHPLLTLGMYGRGKTAAYSSDVAPHWAGGFVDWGETRVTLQAPGSGEVEVGNWYVEFFARLVRWVRG